MRCNVWGAARCTSAAASPLCPGLAVAIADLGAPLEPRRYPALVRLYEAGPTALCEQAAKYGFVARATYAFPCELYDHVRTFLAAHAAGDFPDLRPAEFYTVDAPAAAANTRARGLADSSRVRG